MNTTLKPKDLPCLFESLVERDQNTHLAQCETKEKQKWCFASTERAKLLAKYFPELFLYYYRCKKIQIYYTRFCRY